MLRNFKHCDCFWETSRTFWTEIRLKSWFLNWSMADSPAWMPSESGRRKQSETKGKSFCTYRRIPSANNVLSHHLVNRALFSPTRTFLLKRERGSCSSDTWMRRASESILMIHRWSYRRTLNIKHWTYFKSPLEIQNFLTASIIWVLSRLSWYYWRPLWKHRCHSISLITRRIPNKITPFKLPTSLIFCNIRYLQFRSIWRRRALLTGFQPNDGRGHRLRFSSPVKSCLGWGSYWQMSLRFEKRAASKNWFERKKRKIPADAGVGSA